MLTAVEQKRIRDLITETVKMLCQRSLNFRSKFTVEGLLGITIDDKDVFLINIHEVASSLKGKRHDPKEQSVSCDSSEDRNTRLSESHVVVDYTQPRQMQSARKSSLWQTCCSEPRSSDNWLPCDLPRTPIAHSSNRESNRLGRSLNADAERLETSLSLSVEADADELMSNTSREEHELQDHVTTVKEENISEADASDSWFDCVSRDLGTGCSLHWSNRQDTDIQV